MKIWLAPLHGITNYYFRNTLCDHTSGIQVAIAPFQPVHSAESLNVKKWKDLLPENNTKLEVIPQLMGNVASNFFDTVNALTDLGYNQANWNIGCPMKQIVRRKRGCGLMPYPDLVEEIVAHVTSKTQIRFSVKMRLGMHRREEGREIIERLNHYPLDFIVIHPRLGEWQYEGKPDLDELENLLSFTAHEVIYSGDINTAEDYLSLSKRFPSIHQWMIGRGLLRNPFLAEQISDPTRQFPSDDYKKRFVIYYSDLINNMSAFKASSSILPSLKELWHYFASFWQLSQDELRYLLRINDLETFIDATRKIMD